MKHFLNELTLLTVVVCNVLKFPIASVIFSDFLRKTLNFMKSVCIRSFSIPCFPTFRLKTDNSLNLRIKYTCRKTRTRKTLNADTFYIVLSSNIL